MREEQTLKMTAAEYYSELEASTLDERVKRSLGRIKVACDSIEADVKAAGRHKMVRIDRPMSIVNVGRKCTEMFGGPTAPSIINNRAKEPHKARYIELRAAELEGAISKPPKDDYSNTIADPRIRLYVRSLEHRNSELLKIIRGYSKRFREAPPVALNEVLDAATDVMTAPASPRLPVASKALSDAVLRLTSSDSLANVGLKLENDYVFEAISQNELLQPHHVQALRALLNLSTS